MSLATGPGKLLVVGINNVEAVRCAMQPLMILLGKLNFDLSIKARKGLFLPKKSSKDISIMLFVSVKHYCRGSNGELGRVAGDVQRAAGVVRGGCSVVAT